MARPRIGPDDTTLRRWHAEGLTHQQMADRWAAEMGEGRRVSRSAIGSLLERLGLSRPTARNDAMPWTVRDAHSRSHTAKMLRAMAKEQRGASLADWEQKQLQGYKRRLENDQVVVGYAYDSDRGFVLVERSTVPVELLDPELPIITKDLGALRS